MLRVGWNYDNKDGRREELALGRMRQVAQWRINQEIEMERCSYRIESPGIV